MACNILTEIPKSCDNNIGGIKKFYVINWDYVDTVTEVAGQITAITLLTNSPSYAFVEYAFAKNSSNFVEEAAISLENGSTYYTVTSNLVIPRRELSKRNSLALLAAGQQNLMIILQDGNGLYWLQGWTNGANLTAQGEGSGTAKADGTKYSLSFMSEEPEQMPEIDPSIIAALI